MKLVFTLLVALASCSSHGNLSSARPGNYLVVIDRDEQSLLVIEPNSGWTRDSVPTSPGPREVAASRDGQYAVVAAYGDSTPGHVLDVYDFYLRRMDYSIDVAPCERLASIAFLDRRTTVLVTSESSRAVIEVDLPSRKVVRVMETGGAVPRRLVIANDRSRVYTANTDSGSVSEIDLASGKLVRTVEVGGQPQGIDLSPDGRELWVAVSSANSVSVLDAHALDARASIPCSAMPIRLKLTPDGARALVLNASSGDVAVFDVAERREIARVSLVPDHTQNAASVCTGFEPQAGDLLPQDLLIDPRGRYAYVTEDRTRRLIAIDLESLCIFGAVEVGRAPAAMSWTYISHDLRFMSR
jgi:YVTN family beta-propeller protein